MLSGEFCRFKLAPSPCVFSPRMAPFKFAEKRDFG